MEIRSNPSGQENPLDVTRSQLEQGQSAACSASITLRQAGVEVAVFGTDFDLMETIFDGLYAKYVSVSGYKEGGAAPKAEVEAAEPDDKRAKIAKAMAIRKALAARGGR